MVIPDPGLGFDVEFDADEFRNAIHFAMQMGISPDVDKRPVFLRKSTTVTYKKDGVTLPSPPRLDRDGRPYDPEIEVLRAADTRVSDISCAVEIVLADASELPVGNFRPTKAVVTLLDEEYALVSDCRELIYNGDRYLYGYEPDGLGLFDVGVNTIIYYALDES